MQTRIYNLVIQALQDGVYAEEEYNEDFIYNMINLYMTHPHYTAYILEDNGEDVGIIMGFYSPSFTVKGSIATEHLWWVREDYRNKTSAAKLFKLFEDWAVSKGATHIAVSCYDNDVSKIYTKRGYKLMEKTYVRKI